MSVRGAGDLEENKIFMDTIKKDFASGKGSDDNRISNRSEARDAYDRIFGKKPILRKPKKTKVIYHNDGTKTEITKEW